MTAARALPDGWFACPCGETHQAERADEGRFLAGLIADLGDGITVSLSGKRARLSRVWIAFHGLSGSADPAGIPGAKVL